MRKRFVKAERYRVQNLGEWSTQKGDRFGAFEIPTPNGLLWVIMSDATDEIPWEHVSVSLEDRCPTWEEMCWIKQLFWNEEETVLQFHPKKSQYVLHLWRLRGADHKLPPLEAV